jgi:hypothetical protein
MIDINKNGNVIVSRGDNFTLPLIITLSKNIFDTQTYDFDLNDEVILHVVGPNQPFELPIIEKKFIIENLEDDIIFTFDHKDTVYLFPNTYYYEVKVLRKVNSDSSSSENTSTKYEEKYFTLTERRKFIIM